MMRNAFLVVCSAGALVFSGCGKGDAGGKPAATDPSKPVKVTLALNWYPEMEHGGFYAALVHGDYAAAGLDVEIRPGGPNAPVAPMVEQGQVDFGIENADRILMFRSQKADIIGLMAPLQTSPRCLVVHAESNITKFDELKDVTLAMSSAAPWAVFLTKTLPLENVEVVPNPGNLSLFLDNPKFVQQGYVFSEPVLIEKKGVKVRSLMVSDLGFNPYTSVLIVKGERAEKDAELVRKFVEASRKGWKKYLEDPAETHKKIASLNPEMPVDVLDEGFKAMKPLCLIEGQTDDSLGVMTLERWRTLADQLVKVEVIKPDSVDPASAFTVKFLTPAKRDSNPVDSTPYSPTY